MVQAATYGKVILVTCAIGLGLSGYSFVVKTKKTEDPKYQSICDFNEHMSCSRVLTSEYAKGFGLIRPLLGEDSPLNVPNSVYGASFFVIFGALSLLQKAWSAKIQIGLGVLANVFTVYLGVLLYFVLKDFCLLCVSTYVVNFINLILAYLRLRSLTPKQVGKQKGQQKSQKGQKKQQQQQQNDKQKSPQAEKKKSEKQKSPQPEKQKQNQQKQNQNQNQQKQNQNQNQNQQKQNQNQNQQKQNQNQQKQNQNQQKQSPNQKQNQNQNQQKQSPNQKQNQNQNQNQQNGKVKNQQNDKQKSPKTPNSKKKNN